MADDVIGPIELLIFILIAVVLPVVVMVLDDANWERKEGRKDPIPAGRERSAGDRSGIGLSSGAT
jgi:hypothetical protein